MKLYILIKQNSFEIVSNYINNLIDCLRDYDIDIDICKTPRFIDYVTYVKNHKIVNSVIICCGYKPTAPCLCEPINHVFILNFDQLTMTRKINTDKKIIDTTNETLQCDNIIEWSKENIGIIHKFFPHKNVFHLPYMDNPNDTIYQFPYRPINDVCFIGSMSPRRQKLLEKLTQNNIKCTIIRGVGDVRDQQLNQYKILVNIHYREDYHVFESIRCNPCIYRGLIIISEKSKIDKKQPVNRCVIMESYANIPKKIKYVLNNYEKYVKSYSYQNIKHRQKKYQTRCLNNFVDHIHTF